MRAILGRPVIIALEGLDGSGKTVQANRLKHTLSTSGFKTLLLDFPQYENNYFGKQIGKLLSGKDGISAKNIDGLSMALWYAADRRETLDRYQLSNYDYVIFNRYTYSNVAYQCAAECGGYNEELAEAIKVMEFEGFGLPVPDLNIFLKTTPKVTEQNVRAKGKREYTEGLDVYESSTTLLDNCRTVYSELFRLQDDFAVVDCMKKSNPAEMRSESDIARDVFSCLRECGLLPDSM